MCQATKTIDITQQQHSDGTSEKIVILNQVSHKTVREQYVPTQNKPVNNECFTV